MEEEEEEEEEEDVRTHLFKLLARGLGIEPKLKGSFLLQGGSGVFLDSREDVSGVELLPKEVLPGLLGRRGGWVVE